MIYSKKLQTFIPVNIEKKVHNLQDFGNFTIYTVKDNKIPVGKVHLTDNQQGVKVEYIENMNPQLYSGFGKLADQLEVEHCIQRGLTNFQITSEAALNSHALHYLRGKRFYSEYAEQEVLRVIKETPKGEQFYTKFLGKVRMFMPQELIEKYLTIIKKNPLILK